MQEQSQEIVQFMRRSEAADYISNRYRIPCSQRHLANLAVTGEGPQLPPRRSNSDLRARRPRRLGAGAHDGARRFHCRISEGGARRVKAKKRNPAARSADRASRMICLAAINSENNPSPSSLQVARLTARFRVNPTIAPLVALLAFGEGRE